MRKLLFIALMATTALTAQTLVTPNNIVKATNGSLLLQGTNAAGVATQSVAISNVGHISGRSMDLNGADGISAQKLTLSNGGAITGSTQVITIDAVGNGNIRLMDNTQVQGNITASGVISSSQTIQTTGTGSISSAYNLSAASNKFNVSGDTGNVRTNGTFSAASGSFEVTSLGLTKANQGLSVNGAAGFTVGSQFKVTPSGAVTSNGINNSGQKITGLANGTAATDAVNKSQLDGVQDNLDVEVNRLDDRIDTKADKVQVAQDIQHARQQAIRISNEYTDEKISEVNYKVNTEVKRLDDKLDLEIEANRLAQKRLDDKINSNDEKINQRVKDLEIKIDNRFNAVMSYVGNEFAAVNNRLEGLGASMAALSAAATSSVYSPGKPTNLNIATGVYGKSTAIAVGMSHFFNSETKVSVNWSQGSSTKSAVGIGCGIAF